MFCSLCGHKFNQFSDRCQNKTCTRSHGNWREREARRARESADSPLYVEQTLTFDFPELARAA